IIVVLGLSLGSCRAAPDSVGDGSAIRYITERGGTYKQDNTAPGSPLIEVDLGRADVTDDSLKHLASLRRLRSLSLHGRKITGAGLAALAGLAELRSLDLTNSAVTDEGLKSAAKLVQLHEIKLNGA